MNSIVIHDRKGYLKKRVDTFINSNTIDLEIVFFNENKGFLTTDNCDFFFVINDIDDFFYYVNEYRSFDDFKIIVLDFKIKSEMNKYNIKHYTFLTFCDYLKF